MEEYEGKNPETNNELQAKSLRWKKGLLKSSALSRQQQRKWIQPQERTQLPGSHGRVIILYLSVQEKMVKRSHRKDAPLRGFAFCTS